MKAIIIYFKYPLLPNRGGVERVSIVLGEWLVSKGYDVFYLSDTYEGGSPVFKNNNKGLNDEENFTSLKTFIRNNNVIAIINQAGFLPCCKRLFELKNEVSIISVFHNSLDGMFSHPSIPFLPSKIAQTLSKTNLSETLFSTFFFLKYHTFLKKVVKESHKVVVLSKEYIGEIEKYACKSDNVISIGNPLTLPLYEGSDIKENNVVFLGRMTWQKNPELLLSMWNEISDDVNNWHLFFIGDGELKESLRQMAIRNNINNVHFEGSRDPIPYLKKAKILCMTSVYEGFPLVLYEAMNYGVVPVVFNTFKSIGDIIENGKEGATVEAFDKEKYIKEILSLMDDEEKWSQYSSRAKKKAHHSTIESIGEDWIKLLEML